MTFSTIRTYFGVVSEIDKYVNIANAYANKGESCTIMLEPYEYECLKSLVKAAEGNGKYKGHIVVMKRDD